MKYVHHICFVTELTGDRRVFESFTSNDPIPKQTDLVACIKKSIQKGMKINKDFQFGVQGLSTFLNH